MRDQCGEFAWARKLKVRHLESLLVLDEAGTLTEAAARLHLTQSAMSHWLAEMELLVGSPIVTRGRRLELTAAGKLIKQLAIRVLGDVSRVGMALEAAAKGKASRLHVGSVWAGVGGVLPDSICRFQVENPAVAVTVTEGPFGSLLEGLARKELDVVIGTIDARAYDSGLQHEILFEDGICVVAGRGSPFWGDTSEHKLSALVHENWILPQHGTSMRSQLDSALVDAGVPWLQPRVETSALTTLLALLNSGNYIGICSEEMTRYQVARGTVRRLSIDRVLKFGAVGILWSAERGSETVEDFVRVVREIGASKERGLNLPPGGCNT